MGLLRPDPGGVRATWRGTSVDRMARTSRAMTNERGRAMTNERGRAMTAERSLVMTAEAGRAPYPVAPNSPPSRARLARCWSASPYN
jgi:hypothetical protein